MVHENILTCAVTTEWHHLYKSNELVVFEAPNTELYLLLVQNARVGITIA